MTSKPTLKHFLVSKSSITSDLPLFSRRKIIVNGQHVISVIKNSTDNIKSLLIPEEDSQSELL